LKANKTNRAVVFSKRRKPYPGAIFIFI